ncbi:hypothetical protein [Streptomyces odontomachi]|uniref:hypothetical protein n=1 Tax=Streptomyces odontomachi TaxID=2944940 RepID=UPI00210C4F9C|nr:hypothetical protein [Streptomyces sp. ODS25]
MIALVIVGVLLLQLYWMVNASAPARWHPLDAPLERIPLLLLRDDARLPLHG